MATGPLSGVLAYLRGRAAAPGSGPDSDTELLERFAHRRDESAFAELVARHGPMVLGVCRRLLRHSEDAEDAFQATFLVLARKATSLGRPERLAGFLFGVALRTARKTRARRPPKAVPLEIDPTDPCPQDAEQAELARVLDEEVARLPEAYRVPLILCTLGGRSREEAARELGWSEGAVKGRLERARQRLRDRLQRRGVAPVLPVLLAAAVPPGWPAQAARQGVAFASGLGPLARPAVVYLAEGVLRTMAFTRWNLGLVLSLLLGAGSAAVLALPGTGDAPSASTPRPAPARAAERQLAPVAVAADTDPPRPLQWMHKGGVHALAWSSTGVIATAGQDGTVRLWDSRTGKEIAALTGHDRPVRAVAFSRGKVLASGDEEGKLRLWDMAGRKLLFLTRTSLGKIRSVAFSIDGLSLAAAGTSEAAELYDTPSGKLLRTIKGGTLKETIHAVAFAPDGKGILLGGEVTLNRGTHWNTFYLCEIASGKHLMSSEGPKQQPNVLASNAGRSWPLAYSPDGKTWAAACCDGTIKLGPSGLIKGHRKHITALAFTPDGKQLVSAGLGGTVRVSEVKIAKEVARLTGQGAITALALSPDGKRLAWATSAGLVKVRELATVPAIGKKEE
jgi:RNA polymerase sigma factor (sigma-70 family)